MVASWLVTMGVCRAGFDLGVDGGTAERVIAEIGIDMTVFPTPQHLVSWAGAARLQ